MTREIKDSFQTIGARVCIVNEYFHHDTPTRAGPATAEPLSSYSVPSARSRKRGLEALGDARR